MLFLARKHIAGCQFASCFGETFCPLVVICDRNAAFRSQMTWGTPVGKREECSFKGKNLEVRGFDTSVRVGVAVAAEEMQDVCVDGVDRLHTDLSMGDSLGSCTYILEQRVASLAGCCCCRRHTSGSVPWRQIGVISGIVLYYCVPQWRY